jgi:hypothetical protein
MLVSPLSRKLIEAIKVNFVLFIIQPFSLTEDFLHYFTR